MSPENVLHLVWIDRKSVSQFTNSGRVLPPPPLGNAQKKTLLFRDFQKKTVSANASPVFSLNFVTLVVDFGTKLKTQFRQIMFYVINPELWQFSVENGNFVIY